ncbi:hypothetical protein [Rhodoferax antarcticus]|uniref:Putative membrane protein n=1 Tax=Rhodoferax antarcticus ANT.BR TaxID=1111071 RepID=A0A1Q8YCN9_9BURK|nr:hypothetical protein [Rhodoferax antarcticus]OLP05821.1 putative membrane protein [Rhodoferax antarcticus ANT.BR]
MLSLMGILAAVNHVINFFAPAIWLALLLPLCARLFLKKKAAARTITSQVALHLIVGGVALLVGMLVFGRDGKMLTYLALVLAAASTQWWLSRR